MLAAKRIGALPGAGAMGREAGASFRSANVIYCLGDRGAGCLDLPVEQIMSSARLSPSNQATSIDDAMAMMTRRPLPPFFRWSRMRAGGFHLESATLVKTQRSTKVEHEA